MEFRGTPLPPLVPPLARWYLLRHGALPPPPAPAGAGDTWGNVRLLSLRCWQCLLTQLMPEAGLGVGSCARGVGGSDRASCPASNPVPAGHNCSQNPAGQGSGRAGEPGGLIWGSSGLEAASALFSRNHASVCDHKCKPMWGLHASANLNVASVFLYVCGLWPVSVCVFVCLWDFKCGYELL